MPESYIKCLSLRQFEGMSHSCAQFFLCLDETLYIFQKNLPFNFNLSSAGPSWHALVSCIPTEASPVPSKRIVSDVSKLVSVLLLIYKQKILFGYRPNSISPAETAFLVRNLQDLKLKMLPKQVCMYNSLYLRLKPCFCKILIPLCPAWPCQHLWGPVVRGPHSLHTQIFSEKGYE